MATTADLNLLLDEVRKLNNTDYQNLMCMALDENRPADVQRSIVKYYSKHGHKSAKTSTVLGGVDRQGTALSCPPSLTSTLSAWKCPFIYRSDMVPKNGSIYMDVEKVSLKPTTSNRHEQLAATVAVVNDKKDLILWALISWGEHEVCQLFPSLTRLDQSKLDQGLRLEVVQGFLKMCFHGNKVVGLDIANDLKSLKVVHENIEDLHDYFFENVPHANNKLKHQKCGYKLKDLASYYMKNSTFQDGHHCAISDARMTRDLFKVKEELVKSHPVLPYKIPRLPRSKFAYDKNDVCKCRK